MHELRKLKIKADMGDEIFANMREGCWLIDYTLSRLSYSNNLNQIRAFCDEYFKEVKQLPATY